MSGRRATDVSGRSATAVLGVGSDWAASSAGCGVKSLMAWWAVSSSRRPDSASTSPSVRASARVTLRPVTGCAMIALLGSRMPDSIATISGTSRPVRGSVTVPTPGW